MEKSNEVLLDANFILAPVEIGLDVYQEIKRLIPRPRMILLSCVEKEVQKNKLAVQILEKQKVEKTPCDGNADHQLLKRAKENNSVVCTNDKELIGKLKKNGLPVIFIRGKNHCELIGSLKTE